MIYLTLTLVAVDVCFVVGVSGFIDSLKRGLWRLFVTDRPYPGNISLKPLDCPLCMTFWSCLLAAAIMGRVSVLTVTLSVVLALMAPNIVLALCVLRDGVGWLLHRIQKRI